MLKNNRGIAPIAIMVIIGIVAAGVAGGGAWYFGDQQAKKQKADSDKKIEELEKKIDELEKASKDSEESSDSEISGWKTFSDEGYGFSIKYPGEWVYKDYGKLNEGSKSVAFADSTATLPKEQSDQPAIISVSIADKVIATGDLSQCSANVKKSTATVGSAITATKWSILGNCSEDMYNSKSVIYEVKGSNGKYINIDNYNDTEKTIFEKMLTTFKLL